MLLPSQGALSTLPRPLPPGSLLYVPGQRSLPRDVFLVARCWEYKGDGLQEGAPCVHLETQAMHPFPSSGFVWARLAVRQAKEGAEVVSHLPLG